MKKLLAAQGERRTRLLLGYLGTNTSVLDDVLANKECFSLRMLAVNGRDIAALGVAPQRIGSILHALLDDVMEGRAANEKNVLLQRAAEKT